MLHGLHPVDFATRMRQAVERLGTTLGPQGASIELLGSEDGVVRVRLKRKGHGCAGSTALHQAIRSAFYEFVPDLQRLEIDEINEPAPVAIVPLSSLRRNGGVSTARTEARLSETTT
jgi:Fe-S cluster biogenesis protein NfuA